MSEAGSADESASDLVEPTLVVKVRTMVNFDVV